ncbi:MAG: hypothetical protein ISR83_04020 [Candidatus Marinimicrobia bacterium]|nr:hypothetical protein [Candidatus Neomarinimicrobiota bacterium]
MNWNDAILIFIIFISTVWYVIQPMMNPPISNPFDDDNIDAHTRQKMILMDQIKELEMDYEIGTLNKDDFIQQRNQLKRDISTLLQKIKSQTS